MDKSHIGTRLKQKMDQHGKTAAQVADYFGVRAPSVYGWIKDGRIAKKHVPGLVELFGETAEWWLVGTASRTEGSNSSASQRGVFLSAKDVIDLIDAVLGKVGVDWDTLGIEKAIAVARLQAKLQQGQASPKKSAKAR